MKNPVLNHTREVSQSHHAPTSSGTLTMDGVVRPTFILFATLLALALVGWVFPNVILMIAAAIAALVIGLVAVFKRVVSPPLFLLYSALEGYVLGVFSHITESMAPGAVVQAVLGTFAVFAVMLFLFKTNIITGGSKVRRFVVIGMLAYLLFSLINFVLTMFGVFDTFGGMYTSITVMGLPIGIFIGAFAIILGALSLSVDFRDIRDSIGNVPSDMGWYLGFGLMLSLIWIYTEILRVINIARNFSGL